MVNDLLPDLGFRSLIPLIEEVIVEMGGYHGKYRNAGHYSGVKLKKPVV